MKRKTPEDFVSELNKINKNVVPLEPYINNRTPIKCKCSICGYGADGEWAPTPDTLLDGCGCPKCAGNMKKTTEQFIAELQLINPDIQVLGEYVDNHTPIKCLCLVCGNIWDTTIPKKLLKGSGCQKCRKEKAKQKMSKPTVGKNDLASVAPNLAKEWHPTKNGSLTPQDVAVNSNKNMMWHCFVCNGDYSASPNNRYNRKSGCPYCAGKKVLKGFNDLETLYPELAKEWHPIDNGDLKPCDTTVGHSSPIKWLCPKGHSYSARITDRISKRTGCSICARESHTSFPEQALLYYAKKTKEEVINRDLGQGIELDIFFPSRKIAIEYDGYVWHKNEKNIKKDNEKDEICFKQGIHLYRIRDKRLPNTEKADNILFEKDDLKTLEGIIQSLYHQLFKSQCPDIDIERDATAIYHEYLSIEKENSIATINPELMKEWDYKMNGLLNPEYISYGSSKKVRWKCSRCGYQYPASPAERRRGSGCPCCAGKIIVSGCNDLATTHPQLAKEWHPTLNYPLTPQQVSKGLNTKVWWKCKACGHEWSAEIRKRVAGSGCEECSLATRAKSQYKKVYQFTLEGAFVKEYPSARIAAKEVGISRSMIQHVCSGVGSNKTAGNYLWSYHEDGSIDERKDENKRHSGRIVIQYTKEGQFIREYDSAKIAAVEIGVSESSIRQACKGTHGRKSAGGYIWKYKEVSNED